MYILKGTNQKLKISLIFEVIQ